MRRTYEVSGGRDELGIFHPPDENEMMRKLLAIREHLEDFGGAVVVVPKRVRVVSETGETLRYENWGLLFRYDSSAPAADVEEPTAPHTAEDAVAEADDALAEHAEAAKLEPAIAE